jgi:hypothetical protein
MAATLHLKSQITDDISGMRNSDLRSQNDIGAPLETECCKVQSARLKARISKDKSQITRVHSRYFEICNLKFDMPRSGYAA